VDDLLAGEPHPGAVVALGLELAVVVEVDVHEVDRLQPKGLGVGDHCLSGVEQLRADGGSSGLMT